MKNVPYRRTDATFFETKKEEPIFKTRLIKNKVQSDDNDLIADKFGQETFPYHCSSQWTIYFKNEVKRAVPKI